MLESAACIFEGKYLKKKSTNRWERQYRVPIAEENLERDVSLFKLVCLNVLRKRNKVCEDVLSTTGRDKIAGF